jgi:chromosome segregation ATPase
VWTKIKKYWLLIVTSIVAAIAYILGRKGRSNGSIDNLRGYNSELENGLDSISNTDNRLDDINESNAEASTHIAEQLRESEVIIERSRATSEDLKADIGKLEQNNQRLRDIINSL